MDEHALRIFRLEVEGQCSYILLADEAAHTALTASTGPPDSNAVWMHLQTIVVSAANLSKIFWGSGGRSEEERRPLRDLLKVRDDSPLRDPDLRNDFEHFDQRLDHWLERPYRGGFVGRNLSFEDVHFLRPEERFHHYDIGTGEVSFWDHAVSVPAITEEAAGILERCERLVEPEREEQRRASEERG